MSIQHLYIIQDGIIDIKSGQRRRSTYPVAAAAYPAYRCSASTSAAAWPTLEYEAACRTLEKCRGYLGNAHSSAVSHARLNVGSEAPQTRAEL